MSTSKPVALQQVDVGLRLADTSSIISAIVNSNGSSSTYGIVAAGTNQATATPLVSVINEVDTVTSGTGVALPSTAGKRNTPYQDLFVANNGATILTIYPAVGSTDTINGLSSVTLAPGASVEFTSAQVGKWFAQSSINGFASAQSGTFTLNGATPVTVTNANITANSQVLITLKTVGGTVGTSAPNVRTITAGTGFTVAGIAGDTSIYNYAIIG